MSLPKSVDQDPLLAFAIESGATSASSQSAPHLDQPVVAAAVPSRVPEDAEAREAVRGLRSRVDSLEKTIERSLKDINRLKAEIATLVTVTGDIKKHIARDRIHPRPVRNTSPGLTRLASAFAAVALGVVAGAWFWMNTSNHPIAPPSPPAVAAPSTFAAPSSDSAASSQPAASGGPRPVAQPAIVPVAAVTPVHESRAREANIRSSREPALYVGTLTIDSDPSGQVLVDRKSAGRTPLRLNNLKAGSHLIWIERDGYRRFTRVVQVPSDRVTRLVTDLEPVAQR